MVYIKFMLIFQLIYVKIYHYDLFNFTFIYSLLDVWTI